MIRNITNEEQQEKHLCEWIGDGECCQRTAIYNKSYCTVHYQRIYMILLPEMANYILEKELDGRY